MKYALNEVTMSDLEDFSSKIEIFAKCAEHINHFVWQSIIDTEHNNEVLYELGSLMEMLSDLAASNDRRLSDIIKKIIAS